MADEMRKVVLQPMAGAAVPLGTYLTRDDASAIKRAARECRASLKKLTLPGYVLKCGTTSIPLAQIKGTL